jgi:hypothetical protein
MHKRVCSVAVVWAALLMHGGAIASPVPRGPAEAAATRFCQAVISGGFSYWEFEGKERRRIQPLVSKRLLAHLDNIHACVRDWARHQPPGSTDKPPGVDCCVFSASADWLPTSFSIQKSELLPDGRRRLTVEYQYDSATEHARWHVALYILNEGQRHVVDDFEGGLDDPQSERWLEAADHPQCKQGKWVGPY